MPRSSPRRVLVAVRLTLEERETLDKLRGLTSISDYIRGKLFGR